MNKKIYEKPTIMVVPVQMSKKLCTSDPEPQRGVPWYDDELD